MVVKKDVMMRKDFFANLAALTSAGLLGSKSVLLANSFQSGPELHEVNDQDSKIYPRAITMWDFSWLERRWPGAGYEDWDKALRELKERGYDAVRIDAYPHLLAENAEKEWTLKEVWSIQNWGSPDVNKVSIQPYLNEFIATCKKHGVKVGLSSWFREDEDNTRMKITTPEKHAEIWIKTLDSIKKVGLLDNVMYLDFCNEWPGSLWAPFFVNDPPHLSWGYWHTEKSMEWMKTSIGLLRKEYPEMLINYSFDNFDVEKYSERDLSFFDFAEHHIWMVKGNNSEFYREIKERSKAAGRPVDVDGLHSNQVYKNLVAEGEKLYYEKPDTGKK
jgi:hypothetical protein